MELRILIVDDHDDTIADCRAAFAPHPHLLLDCAKSLVEALTALRTHVYDLIIVDLQLDVTRPHVLEGEEVLAYAALRHPIADLYAWTSYPSLRTTTTLVTEKLLNPDEPVARRLCGLIDKTLFEAPAKALEVALACAGARLSNSVRLDLAKLRLVLERLSEGRTVVGWTEPEEVGASAQLDELQYLVSRLFGQGTRAGRVSMEREVEIDMFDELAAQGDEAHTGSSGAAVFLARARGGASPAGEWVVVKFGSKSHVENEVGRYERYVRYDRAAKHRVELLGHVLGNNVGAIAYSLAGPDPQHSQTIATPLKARDDRAISVIATLFSSEWKHWHGVEIPAANPLNFMQSEFEYRYLDRLEKFLDGVRAAITWRAKQSGPAGPAWWTTEGDRLFRSAEMPGIPLPGQDLNNALSTHVSFAICHGDSHAANIICTAENEPRLIDYAATGPGPRALDFVVFEASHRVIQADGLDLDACARTFLAESELWDLVWDAPRLDVSSARAIVDTRTSFWERLSATVLTSFRVSFSDATPEEYARVAVLHGVRLAPIWWVDDRKSGAKRRKHCIRVRLSAWMGPMVGCLRA